MRTKICTKCKKEFLATLGNFYKQKLGKYGLRSICKGCGSEQGRRYNKENKNKSLKRYKKYRMENRDKIKRKRREYYYKNKAKVNRIAVEYRNNNIQAKLACNLRRRLNSALRGNQKTGSAVKDLGISVEGLKKYLESKFYNNVATSEEMNWYNYGYKGWHMDHIIPLSIFDLTDRKQFLESCHYTNLQPLWAGENMSKGDKI